MFFWGKFDPEQWVIRALSLSSYDKIKEKLKKKQWYSNR